MLFYGPTVGMPLGLFWGRCNAPIKVCTGRTKSYGIWNDWEVPGSSALGEKSRPICQIKVLSTIWLQDPSSCRAEANRIRAGSVTTWSPLA